MLKEKKGAAFKAGNNIVLRAERNNCSHGFRLAKCEHTWKVNDHFTCWKDTQHMTQGWSQYPHVPATQMLPCQSHPMPSMPGLRPRTLSCQGKTSLYQQPGTLYVPCQYKNSTTKGWPTQDWWTWNVSGVFLTGISKTSLSQSSLKTPTSLEPHIKRHFYLTFDPLQFAYCWNRSTDIVTCTLPDSWPWVTLSNTTPTWKCWSTLAQQ